MTVEGAANCELRLNDAFDFGRVCVALGRIILYCTKNSKIMNTQKQV
jgi:hypothetical protein